jgi:hypothetical protein
MKSLKGNKILIGPSLFAAVSWGDIDVGLIVALKAPEC